MDRFDIRPTVAEFFLLRKLYLAKREGKHLTSTSKPKNTRRLDDRDLIIVKPPSALSSQGQWCIYLPNDGEDYYLFWSHRLTVWAISIVVTLLIAVIGIA